MELFSPEFFSALFAIVVIDLVLAGDNAIVIALAARSLPPELRNKAIGWGTVGAIVVRSAMTIVVVWLLKIPGLLLAGGALLLWIAYKLLVDSGQDEGHNVSPSMNFWSAMRTIVVADAVMGLDNVLAVAGAANGSFLLVVLGLLISIPIVIWGSQLILKFVQKYPSIVYVGAGVLVWTGVKMMSSEPLVMAHVAAMGAWMWVLYAVALLGVLVAGFRKNHGEVASRVAAHVVDLAQEPVRSETAAPGFVHSSNAVNSVNTLTQGANIMLKVLIPIDGSANSLQAVRHVINRTMSQGGVEVHLLHVRPPFSKHVAQFSSRRNRESWHRDLAESALAPARALLKKHGVPHATHVELGDRAETIDRVAQRLRVTQIVMGTARKNSLTRLLQDSVTARVLEIARAPVEVIAGSHISKFEKYGLPAGIGAALAALLVAAD